MYWSPGGDAVLLGPLALVLAGLAAPSPGLDQHLGGLIGWLVGVLGVLEAGGHLELGLHRPLPPVLARPALVVSWTQRA